MERVFLGVDVGSVSVKAVVINEKREILFKRYVMAYARGLEVLIDLLKEVIERFAGYEVVASFTGSGGRIPADITGCVFINEIVAHARAVNSLYPKAKSIIDIGGEDAKVIFLSDDGSVRDFSMNTMCAAGTGSFLEEQAARLNLEVEELGKLAVRAAHVPRVAGRCSVFAKSDMIHLQQEGTPVEEIVAGLCYAIARNIKGNLLKGRRLAVPVVFQGGVAANVGVRKALMDVLDIPQELFIVPENYEVMGAIGAAIIVSENGGEVFSGSKVGEIKRYIESRKIAKTRMVLDKRCELLSYPKVNDADEIYVGIDIGSVSFKIVALDGQGRLFKSLYIKTSGRPLDALETAFVQFSKMVGQRKVKGVGVTGSGRYFVGNMIGADVIVNEISAQAKAAFKLMPDVDTVFEIGGQDSKYISMENGVVVDFTMNKACAAGTGSFLEEQAARLGIDLNDIGKIALSSRSPCELGDRCTVFMQSDVIHYQQLGVSKRDIVAGLCYSIALNYLNRVVEHRKIGEKILFQGATALNDGIIAAFSTILNKKIYVPEDCNITGAIGVALFALESVKGDSKFKGWDVASRRHEVTVFECKSCENRCDIKRLNTGSEILFYGGKCELWDNKSQIKPDQPDDLITIRNNLLESYVSNGRGNRVIGIPRIFLFWEWLPFFATFFQELGFDVLVSSQTTRRIAQRGGELAGADICFPAKAAHAHVEELLGKEVDFVFVPHIPDLPTSYDKLSYGKLCPYVQAFPWYVRTVIDSDRLLSPVLHLGLPLSVSKSGLKQIAKALGVSLKAVEKAIDISWDAQRDYWMKLKDLGRQALEDDMLFVLVGRPYNTCDPGLNMFIHKKLKNIGLNVVSLDMLPIEEDETVGFMFWRYGQRILKAADFVRENANLFAIYVTNFACGPDAFILHHFRDRMSSKPFLELEIDEHSADAGIVTRLEAFYDSIRNRKLEVKNTGGRSVAVVGGKFSLKDRKIYVPYMCDHVMAVSSAFKACGFDSEVMPVSDEDSIRIGRRFTSGKECFPAVLTTGDIVKLVSSPSFEAERSAIFMPSGDGPCRFGQYSIFHKLVLKKLGVNVPVFSPKQGYGLYDEIDKIGTKFRRLAWKGVVAIDLLDKLSRRYRPYADENMVDKLYDKHLKRICEAISLGKDEYIVDAISSCIRDFESLSFDSIEKPRVGIVGEIYTRAHKFANEDLVRRLERLGAEVLVAPISEWILYINFTSKRWAKRFRKYRALLKLIIENAVQKMDMRFIESMFSDTLGIDSEPSVEELMRRASAYLNDEFEGEAVLSVGKALDFVSHNVDGIVNVMPFSCMPGNIVSMILKKISEEHGKFVISLSYDGQKELSTQLRLESFIQAIKTAC